MTGNNTPVRIVSLKKRAQFVYLSEHGRRFAMPNFIMLLGQSQPPCPENDVRLGITVTKKVGNSVVRNRVRRRLREAFRQAALNTAKPGSDYVLIARNTALQCGYETLIRDLQFAIPRLHAGKGSSSTSRKSS